MTNNETRSVGTAWKKIGNLKSKIENDTAGEKFCGRMSRFRARCCIKEYETILFRKKETPGCTGDDHARSSGNIHPNVRTNHYHL